VLAIKSSHPGFKEMHLTIACCPGHDQSIVELPSPLLMRSKRLHGEDAGGKRRKLNLGTKGGKRQEFPKTSVKVLSRCACSCVTS
jgi:hypothetical protein